jgi:DNA-directed RNA polymerase subunit RPC12/RpoP
MSETPNPAAAAAPEPRGIACPVCGCKHFRVTNTELLARGRVRRRKRCRHCGRKIVTLEGTIGALRGHVR